MIGTRKRSKKLGCAAATARRGLFEGRVRVDFAREVGGAGGVVGGVDAAPAETDDSAGSGVVCPDPLGVLLVVEVGRAMGRVLGRRERLATGWKSPVGAMARSARGRRAKA